MFSFIHRWEDSPSQAVEHSSRGIVGKSVLQNVSSSNLETGMHG